MKNIITIDIGSKNLHLAEGSYKKGKLQVKTTSSYPLPQTSVEGGMVLLQAELGDAIDYAKRAANMQAREAGVTINAAENIMIKELDLPKAKPKELESIIHNEMVQIHGSKETDIIQYKEVPKRDQEQDQLKSYQIVSLSKNLVGGYYEAVKASNLKPQTLDLNMNAIEKLFNWAEDINDKELEEGKATLLIDFGHRTTSVYIASKGQIFFHRHISKGSGEIDQILASDLFLDQEEIERIKREVDFFDPSLINSENDPYKVLRPYFMSLNDEIRKVLTFFRGRFRQLEISGGYIFGNGSQIKRYSEFWDLNLNLPIEQIQTIKGKNAEKISVHPAHINAIAALIRN